LRVVAEDDRTELDRFSSARHPRETERLFGHAESEQRFLQAYQSGRMPHAWLLSGPEGIGKASFAYRAARFLLSHPDGRSDTVQRARTLDSPLDSVVGRRVLAQSHGGLTVVRREIESGKKTIPTEIKVDQIRRLIQFFETTSGEEGWRIAIIDTLDEVNRSGANALLKLIEEPPERSLFLMVTHAPGRLLPTIRSRCRVLPFKPLQEEDILKAINDQPEHADPSRAREAARHAHGSVREALSLLDPSTLATIAHVETLLGRLPTLDRSEILEMADGLTGRDKTGQYETVIDTVQNWIADQCRLRAGEGIARLAPLAELWEKNARLASETDRYNLDRRPFILALFVDLAETVRASLRV
jgi:DNA polymerase III subunit delta'